MVSSVQTNFNSPITNSNILMEVLREEPGIDFEISSRPCEDDWALKALIISEEQDSGNRLLSLCNAIPYTDSRKFNLHSASKMGIPEFCSNKVENSFSQSIIKDFTARICQKGFLPD